MNCYLILIIRFLILIHPSYITNCVGIEPQKTGCKSDTLTQDYLPDSKSLVNIQLKCVMVNTTYAFHRSVFFLPGGLPVFINGYGVSFLSYYMLVLLIDLHKQLRSVLGPYRIFDP